MILSCLRGMGVISLTALLLVACGGGGDDQTTTAQSSKPAQKVADVTFTNVATNPLVASVMPGELLVEIAAFRIVWKDNTRYTIGQLIFKNQYAGNISETIKKFQLVDGSGNDITNEANYVVNINNERQEVVIDFYFAPWYAFDSQTGIPKTYSLLASIDPLAQEGRKFAFNLSSVQMHEAGKEVLSQVVGGDFKVMKVSGSGLPVITKSTPSSITVDNTNPGALFTVGSFTVECPKDNLHPCVFTQMNYRSNGVAVPYLAVDDVSVTSYIESQPNGSYKALIHYVLYPGSSAVFNFVASAPGQESKLLFSVGVEDLFFMIGNKKVSPILPSTIDSCDKMIQDGRNCKG